MIKGAFARKSPFINFITLKNILKAYSVILVLITTIGCSNTNQSEGTRNEIVSSPTNKIVLSSEIIWQKLNPARGDQSPQAGTIWGDRNGKVPTGFLAKFADGFSSPPHIHNVTYRALVIKGLIHNDDPNAENMWMPSGSFWTQPAGESHITSSKGESIAYVEIDSGPYLVKPIDEKFDNGEHPINISTKNIIWLGIDETKMLHNENSEIAFLWESKQLKGRLIKIKAGFEGEIQNLGNIFHAVIIQGGLEYNSSESKKLDPGSYFTATEKSKHQLKSINSLDCLIYIRTNGDLKII